MHRPVLIVGAEPRIVITIARSLHARQVPVHVVTLGSASTALRSTAVDQVTEFPLDESPQRLVEQLAGHVAAHGYGMIVPASDSALTVLAHAEGRLPSDCHVACPSADVLQRVLNKGATLEAARRCGIPIPTTYHIADAAMVDLLRGELRFPLVAKPRTKPAEGGFKTMAIGSFEELESAFITEPNFGKHNLIQEHCSGEGVGVEILMHQGRPLATFQHRRVKEYPVSGGVSVVAESVPLDDRLAGLSAALLQEIQWEGVAMVEYKVNQASGEFALMEVNGRYWGSLPLSRMAGIDFPYYQWQLAHGESPAVAKAYRVGVRMRWTAGILMRLHEVASQAFARGRPRALHSLGSEIRAFVAAFGPGVRDALWAFDDPLPALAELGRAATKLMVSDIRGLVGRCVPAPFLRYRESEHDSPAGPGQSFPDAWSWVRWRRLVGIRPCHRPWLGFCSYVTATSFGALLPRGSSREPLGHRPP